MSSVRAPEVIFDTAGGPVKQAVGLKIARNVRIRSMKTGNGK